MAGVYRWKTVWITGASTGIGREMALQLAAAGVTVLASARSADKLAELCAQHANIRAYPLDVTDKAAVAATTAAIERDVGLPDLVILNAGVWHPMGAADYDVDKAMASMDVNYNGVVLPLACIMPGMIARKAGHIALVSSVAGYRGLPQAAAYAPTKAALINLAETLKPDLGRHGVTVSIVNPGFVDTPMTKVNDFPMPLLITAPDAAARILRGLAWGRYEIAFPLLTNIGMKLFRFMPNALFFLLARGMVK